MNIFESAFKWLSDNQVTIGTMVGILFAIAKGVSTEGAPKVVAAIQGAIDMIAKLVSGLGSVLKFISDLLANLIKSDGILGKK